MANGRWRTPSGAQHQLVQAGECAFGVQGLVKDGNIGYLIGNQDIIDIINESIERFGGSGRVGAKGTMSCKGDGQGAGRALGFVLMWVNILFDTTTTSLFRFSTILLCILVPNRFCCGYSLEMSFLCIEVLVVSGFISTALSIFLFVYLIILARIS